MKLVKLFEGGEKRKYWPEESGASEPDHDPSSLA